MGGAVFFFIFMVILVVVIFRLVAGGMDDERVRQYVASKGGRVLEKRWEPFGRGWAGEKNARIYHIRYVDREGNIHEASCKTSAMSGVYFTEDRIVKEGPSQPEPPWSQPTMEPARRPEPSRPPEPTTPDWKPEPPEPPAPEPEVVYREDPSREEYIRTLEEENRRLREELEQLKTRQVRKREDKEKRDGEGFLRE